MIWSLIQSVGGQAILMLVYLVLAALLSPEDFGLVGLATVWTAVLSAFAELGFGAALIQRREIGEEHSSTTFALNVGVGTMLSAVGVATSWPIAAWFDEPRLQSVLAVLSTGFILRSLGLTHVALAQRHLRFRSLAIRDVAANTLAGLAGLVLAVRGAGVWSLVAVSLVSAAAGSALMWRIDSWRPSVSRVSVAALHDLWHFSSSILGFNLFKSVVQNIDRVIIGHLLGTAAVGFYSLASRLVIQPLAVPIGALGVYLFPKVARVQDDLDAARRSYRLVLSMCLAIAVPYVIVVTRLAPPLVPRAFGSEWLPAIPLVGWLGIAAVVRAVFSPATQLMKALGRPDLMLRWSVVITVLTAGALIVGASWGVTGVAAAFAVAHVVGLAVLVPMMARLSRFGFVDHVRTSARSLGVGVLVAAALAIIAARFPRSDWLIVAATVVLGGTLGLALLLRERTVATRLRAALGREPSS